MKNLIATASAAVKRQVVLFGLAVAAVATASPVLAAEPTYTSPIADVLEAFPVSALTADMTAFVTSNLGLSLVFVISGVVLVLIRRAFRG